MTEEEQELAQATQSKWLAEQKVGTMIGRGGVKVKTKTGVDRIRYDGQPVGNCPRAPGSPCFITHPVEEISDADYADLRKLLAERDADRFNRLYRGEGEAEKTPADYMDRAFDIVDPNYGNLDMAD